MSEIIEKNDLSLLFSVIDNIHTFSRFDTIIEHYIQFLYNNNIDFHLKMRSSFLEPLDSRRYSSDYIFQKIKKSKLGGFIELHSDFNKKQVFESYLYSYIGKPLSSLEPLLKNLMSPNVFNKNFYAFYRSKGFFLLNLSQKDFLSLFEKKYSPTNIFHVIQNININLIEVDYLISQKSQLSLHDSSIFKENISSFEQSINNNNSFNQDKSKILSKMSKSFLLQLMAGLILNHSEENNKKLISDYQNILSFSTIYNFFKLFKNHSKIFPLYQHYQNIIHQSKEKNIHIEEISLFQKKYQFDLAHLLQKNTISYSSLSLVLTRIANFFKTQGVFNVSLTIQENENTAYFLLSSYEEKNLDECKIFLHHIFNNKNLLLKDHDYPVIFHKINLENSLKYQSSPTKTIKI